MAVDAQSRPAPPPTPGIGSLLVGAFHVYGAGAGTLLAIAAVAMAPLAILNVVATELFDVQGKLQTWANVFKATYVPGTPNPDLHWELLAPAAGAIAGQLAVTLVFGLLLGTLSYCALIKASHDLLESDTASVGSAYRTAAARFFPLVLNQAILWGGLALVEAAVIVLLAIATHGLAVILAPLLLLLAIRFAVAGQAVVIDGLGPIAALVESWRLTSGRFWKVLVFLVVIGILSGIASAIISSPASMASGSSLSPAFSALFSGLASVLVSPLTAAAATLLYFTLKGGHEELVTGAAPVVQRWVPAYSALKIALDGRLFLNAVEVRPEDVEPLLAAIAKAGTQLPVFLERPDQAPSAPQAAAVERSRTAGVRLVPGEQATSQWGQLRTIVVEVAPMRFRFSIEKARLTVGEDSKLLRSEEVSFATETQLLKVAGLLATANRVIEAGEPDPAAVLDAAALAEPSVHLKLDFGQDRVFRARFRQEAVPAEIWSFCFGLRALATGWMPSSSEAGEVVRF